MQAEALAEPISIATANGGLVQAHIEVGSLAVIQQAKIAVKAKVLDKTLKGIDLIVGMDCLRAMQANLKCGQAVCEVQLQGKTEKLRPINDDIGQEDGHMLLCSVEQLRNVGKTEVLSPKQAVKLLKQGVASWLMLVQKDQYGMDQGTTCASMVAGQEEGVVAPEAEDEFKDVFEPVDVCPPARGGGRPRDQAAAGVQSFIHEAFSHVKT